MKQTCVSKMRLLCCLAILGISQIALGQYRILGFVYDAAEQPFATVEVQLTGGEEKLTTFTDLEGRFEFTDIARGDYTVLVITDYGLIEKDVKVRTSIEMHLQRARIIKTDEVVVHAVRAGDEEPIAQDNLDRDEIEVRNLGQDVPYLLKWSPSVVTTSDAGTGIGYTGIRVRGSDPTRVNVTINGVPLNDAESQSVFWVDLPDLLSSTESIQIQRGVGSSTFGTGAFGASINLNTISTHIKPYAKLSGSAGSFGTTRANVQLGTGLLGNHFTIDGRLSKIKSDGYIDRGSADLESYYISAAYIGAKSSLRFISFGGHEVTYQAWNGVPVQFIDDPELRTFNSAGTEKLDSPHDNEVDDYKQTHYQLHWNSAIFTQIQTFATLNYTKGSGFFEQYKNPDFFESAFSEFLATNGLADGDAIRRRWLDNDFYGAIAGLHYQDPSDKYEFRIGGGLHTYKGGHFGEVIWSAAGVIPEGLPNYYENDAVKKDKTLFTKLNYVLGPKVSFTVDLQLRGVDYEFEGLDDDGSVVTQDVSHSFFNPKAGLSYKLSEFTTLHYFGGIAHREPNRNDYVNSSPTSRPKAERLIDQELTLRVSRPGWHLGLTGYTMFYKDHLTVTGRLNDVGEYTRQNVARSHRIGLEAEVMVQATDRLRLIGQATLSENRIDEFEEFVDNWDYWNQDFENTPPEELEPLQFQSRFEDTDLAFSPGFVTSGQIEYKLVESVKHSLTATLAAKYVGEQFLDNTSNPESLLESYSFTDLGINYAFQWTDKRMVKVHLLVRNIFNADFVTNGWIYRFRSRDWDPRESDPYPQIESGNIYHLKGLYPQAGRNVLFGVTIEI